MAKDLGFAPLSNATIIAINLGPDLGPDLGPIFTDIVPPQKCHYLIMYLVIENQNLRQKKHLFFEL